MLPNCQECSLKLRKKEDFLPVATEHHPSDQIVLLGEAPGGHEEIEGRPFVGPTGQELQSALDSIGVRRDECQINNAIACRPPRNRLDTFMTRLSRENIKRRREDKPTLLSPQECCQPRVLGEIEGFTKIICLGATAASLIRGSYTPVMSMRGACEIIQKPWGEVRVAYTVHPAFVLRSPKWRPVFRTDLRRALRFFKGGLTWVDPEIKIVKDYADFAHQMKRLVEAGEPVAYDVETDSKNPLSAALRCVAISNDNLSVVIPLLGIDGRSRFFSPGEDEKVRRDLRAFLSSGTLPIIGHNAGQYDRLVCINALGVDPKLSADTLLLHLLVNNEMPHNLGFIVSVYTDFVEAWKASHSATKAKDDEELHIYCAKDACVTARIARPLALEVKSRNQWHLVDREHDLQRVGVGMQRLGLRVDQERLLEHELEFELKLKKSKDICAEIADKDFNPNSTLQLRKLLFNEWRLTPEKYNEKTGDPSTDDETLRKMITHHNLEEEKRVFVQAVRMVRRYSKLLGTYIRPLKDQLILEDGRIHPSYNRLPATGRYSSSAPNAQNIPAFLRDLFIPEEGHIFVGADMDQLELRLIAEEANAARLLDIINNGLDPHNENMEYVYGKSIWSLEGAPDPVSERRKKGSGVFKRTRGITKNVFYAWQYAASVPTIHQQVVSVEDDDGNLIYAHLSHRDVRDVVRGLNKAIPEIPSWWDFIRRLYRKQGFIADNIWQRRRDFKDEEKINELVNHPIQAGGASIVHEAMLQLVQGHPGWGTKIHRSDLTAPARAGLFSFDFENKTGLVNQCHDSLLFEVKEDDGEEAAKLLQQMMTRERKEGKRLVYTAEAEIAKNWKEA